MISLEFKKIVERLIKIPDVAANLINKLSLQEMSSPIIKDDLLRAVGFSKRSEALTVIKILIEEKILVEKEECFLCCTLGKEKAHYLSGIFSGIYYHRSGVMTMVESEVVLTYPRSPSMLSEALSKIGPRITHIQNTDEIFSHLSQEAKRSFVILTPFLDSCGAQLVRKLFENARRDVDKILILRFLTKDQNCGLYPKGYDDICDDLASMGVSVYDYSICRKGSNQLETFHAKVVLADDSMAYIGSANMSQYSLDNSMELGALVKGSSARRVRDIIDMIIEISKLSRSVVSSESS